MTDDDLGVTYDDRTKDELLALAAERGLEVGSKATKADIIEALVAFDLADDEDFDEDDLDEAPEEEAPVVTLPRKAQVLDFREQAALEILADIHQADSRWADLSGRDPEAVAYAVERGWLSTEPTPQKHGRYMLTERGIRALEN